MTQLEQIESSQRQHHEDIQQQMRIELLEIEQQYKLFAMLKPKIYKDGNEWCVLLGDNIETGIVGFGESAHEAILAWDCSFNSKK